MTETQAEAKGYEFTGIYSRLNDDDIKRRAKELREQGNRAMVVPSEGGGYAVYWKESDANRAMREAAEHKREVAALWARRADAVQKLAEINAALVARGESVN